jgi:hypothetical protein
MAFRSVDPVELTSPFDQVLADGYRCSASHIEDGAALIGQRRHELVQPRTFDQSVTAVARPTFCVTVIQRDDPNGVGMLVNHTSQYHRGVPGLVGGAVFGEQLAARTGAVGAPSEGEQRHANPIPAACHAQTRTTRPKPQNGNAGHRDGIR